VLATHQAADGAVARVRVPGGQLTPAAFAAIAAGAAELGDGTIELTSRANLQVRGLADGVELGARLTAAGLLPSATHERVRNIMASPLTGLDGLGFADVRPLVAALDRELCARPRLAELPGRFLFAVDDGRGDVAWLGADVAALLTSENSAVILLGGEDGGLRAPLDAVVELMLTCAEAFLTVRSDEWRIGEVTNGTRRIADHVAPPTCREGAPRDADTATPPRPESAPRDANTATPPRPESAPRDAQRPESAPRGEGQRPESALRGEGQRPEGAPRGIRLGPVAHVGGRVSLVVGAPLGWLDRRQAAALVATGAPLVVTPWRSIVIAGPADPTPLREAGLLLDPDDPRARVTACTGRPGCAKALADVRAEAAPVPGTSLPVHWSGCERRCGRPRGAVVDVVATGHGYSVTEGDR
jgi:precorrin-3B synthase